MIKNNKKSLSNLMSVLLLLFIVITSIISFDVFCSYYFSKIQSKFEANSDVGMVIIKNVVSGNNNTSIFIKNEKLKPIIIKEVIINKNKCNIIGSNVLDSQSINKINVNCILSKEEIAEILIVTDDGLFDKTLITS